MYSPEVMTLSREQAERIAVACLGEWVRGDIKTFSLVDNYLVISTTAFQIRVNLETCFMECVTRNGFPHKRCNMVALVRILERERLILPADDEGSSEPDNKLKKPTKAQAEHIVLIGYDDYYSWDEKVDVKVKHEKDGWVIEANCGRVNVWLISVTSGQLWVSAFGGDACNVSEKAIKYMVDENLI